MHGRAEEQDPGDERGEEPGAAHASTQERDLQAHLKATDETT
jgi:hypothetical protein